MDEARERAKDAERMRILAPNRRRTRNRLINTTLARRLLAAHRVVSCRGIGVTVA